MLEPVAFLVLALFIPFTFFVVPAVVLVFFVCVVVPAAAVFIFVAVAAAAVATIILLVIAPSRFAALIAASAAIHNRWLRRHHHKDWRSWHEATEARQWRQLVRAIIERVVVHPLPKKGVALEVHGQLAVLLAAVAAWNAEEARFRLEIRNQYKSLKERGAFQSAQDRIDFIEMMNNELEKRKRSFERFQSTVVAGA